MSTAVDVSAADAHRQAAELAARHSLSPVGKRPPLGRYVQQLWVRRHFITTLAVARVVARNHEDRLGVLWNVVRPLLLSLIYGLVFGVLLPASTRPRNWTAFIVIGVIVFTFSSDCLSKGSRSVTRNRNIVRALHFPKALLPVAQTLEETIATLPAFAILFVVVLATGADPALRWLLIIPVVVLQAMFNLGVAFVTARITTSIRDFAQLIPFLTRFLFYVSGIFYDVRKFHTHHTLFFFVKVNPFHVYIALARQALLGGHYAGRYMWMLGALWAAVFLVVAFLVFWAAEERYGRE